ncbi:MAG: zinc ribbon domain-containing protein, partial [Prevotella sp.]|nr:zinc ribbon domain-containing protein [Prevotella sp.]
HKCQNESENDAIFCSVCGFKLKEKFDKTNVLLLAWCVSLIFFMILNVIVSYLIRPWLFASYPMPTAATTISIIYAVIGIIQSLTHLVVPFAIPKIGYRIAAFIIVGIAVVITIISHISSIISTLSLPQ